MLFETLIVYIVAWDMTLTEWVCVLAGRSDGGPINKKACSLARSHTICEYYKRAGSIERTYGHTKQLVLLLTYK